MKIPIAGLGIVACASSAFADGGVVYFTAQERFNAQMRSHNKFLKGVEDLGYANVQQAGTAPLPDNLSGNTPHSGVFPIGLVSPGLAIRTNRIPGPFAPVDVPSNNPRASGAVAIGALGADSFKVGEDRGILSGIRCGMDLIFRSNDKTGVGFELSRFASFGNAGWTLGIFNINDVVVGQFVIPRPIVSNPSRVFFGVRSPNPIGRINVCDPDTTSPDPVDDIQISSNIPSPGGVSLLAMDGLLAARRRC